MTDEYIIRASSDNGEAHAIAAVLEAASESLRELPEGERLSYSIEVQER